MKSPEEVAGWCEAETVSEYGVVCVRAGMIEALEAAAKVASDEECGTCGYTDCGEYIADEILKLRTPPQPSAEPQRDRNSGK